LKIDFDNLSAKFGKEMHLVGDYRPILAMPEDMQWEFGTYDDIEIPFTADDWTLLQQQQGVSPDTPIIEKKEVSLQDESSIGKFLGIKVSFTLPSSCYATMMIRELTKESSKKTHQVTMYNAEQTRVLGPGWQEEEAKAKALLAEQAAAAIEAEAAAIEVEAAAVAVAASTVPTKMDTTAN
jgi:hypothetical protein